MGPVQHDRSSHPRADKIKMALRHHAHFSRAASSARPSHPDHAGDPHRNPTDSGREAKGKRRTSAPRLSSSFSLPLSATPPRQQTFVSEPGIQEMRKYPRVIAAPPSVGSPPLRPMIGRPTGSPHTPRDHPIPSRFDILGPSARHHALGHQRCSPPRPCPREVRCIHAGVENLRESRAEVVSRPTAAAAS